MSNKNLTSPLVIKENQLFFFKMSKEELFPEVRVLKNNLKNVSYLGESNVDRPFSISVSNSEFKMRKSALPKRPSYKSKHPLSNP